MVRTFCESIVWSESQSKVKGKKSGKSRIDPVTVPSTIGWACPLVLSTFVNLDYFSCHTVVVGVRPLAYRHEESECMYPTWVPPSRRIYNCT